MRLTAPLAALAAAGAFTLTCLTPPPAAATPASATASTRTAAHQSVLASTCDRDTFYSHDQWSKGNTQLCVDVAARRRHQGPPGQLLR
ncbi:hypothetical protein [Nonomuraea sp. NPDC046570]|uniref:hypothetical protein n=1 Tax=Nonomuraea sp. NPDC046570 TaxID=3155255 RepID=UPI0033C4F163